MTLRRASSAHRPYRPHRAQLGQAIVEFAFVAPALLFIAMGLVDFGRVFYAYQSLANAAREGARHCALNPGDAAGVQTRVLGEINGTVPSVTSSGCTNPGEGNPVTVVVAAPFSPLTVGMCAAICDSTLAPNTLALRAASTMVVW